MRRDALHVRFIRAVYRRLVLVRAVERAGICVVVAGGFSLVAALVLMSRGEDALQWCAGALLVGAGIGLGWGLVRRPGMIEAASAADRQFGLSDLLSSALLSRADDAWSRAVIAIADQRCRGLSGNAVVLHRLGGRAWGGIGLSLALVLTVGAMSNVMMQERSSARAREVRSALTNGNDTDSQARGMEKQKTRDLLAASDQPGVGHAGRHQAPDESRSVDLDENASEASASSSNGAELKHREAPGEGLRESSSDVADSHQRLDEDGGRGRDSDANAAIVSGGGSSQAEGNGSQSDSASDGGQTGGRADAASSHRNAPPWQSKEWSADRESALRAIEAGKVPDRSRDVVREYFKD